MRNYDCRPKSREITTPSNDSICEPHQQLPAKGPQMHQWVRMYKSIAPKVPPTTCRLKRATSGPVYMQSSDCHHGNVAPFGHNLSVASINSSLQGTRSCSWNHLSHLGLRGRISVNITASAQTLVVYIGGAQDLDVKVEGTALQFYVQLSLVPDVSAVPMVYLTQIVRQRAALFDETFDIPVKGVTKHQCLLVEVIQAVPEGKDELVGSMSFGVQHLLCGRRTVKDWFYLLNEELGARKQFRVGCQNRGLQVKRKSTTTQATTGTKRLSLYQSTPVPHMTSSGLGHGMSSSHKDLSYITVYSHRDQALHMATELDLLNISDDEDDFTPERATGGAPLSCVPTFHPTSAKVSPRSYIPHLLDQVDLTQSSFFTNTAFFSESMEELRGGDTLRPRLESQGAVDKYRSSRDLQGSTDNLGSSEAVSSCRNFWVENGFRRKRSSENDHAISVWVNGIIFMYALWKLRCVLFCFSLKWYKTFEWPWAGSSLVQVMPVTCWATIHHLNQCWDIVNWTLGNKLE